MFQIQILFFSSCIIYVFCSFSSFCLFLIAGLPMHIIFCHSRCKQMVFYLFWVYFSENLSPLPVVNAGGAGNLFDFFIWFISLKNGRMLQIFFLQVFSPKASKAGGPWGMWPLVPQLQYGSTSSHLHLSSQGQHISSPTVFQPSKSLQVGILD